MTALSRSNWVKLGRLGNGERIAAVSAILLFAFMCLHWFGTKDSGELRLFSVERTAWEALDYIPIVLLITIVVTLASVVLRRPNSVRKPPIPILAVVAILGAVSMSLILFRILHPPNFGSFREIWGTIAIEGTVQFPVFLALFAAAGIACGACLAMREEGISLFGPLARRRRDQGPAGSR
jgi:hypothetical protein